MNHDHVNAETSNNHHFCYFHPKQSVIGVCPFCLNERLLIIAAKQGTTDDGSSGCSRRHGGLKRQPPPSSYRNIDSLPKSKIFALGSLLNRLEIRRRRHDSRQRRGGYLEEDFAGGCHDDLSTSSSLEDSFISIKFEDNGPVASWDKKNIKPQGQLMPNKPFNDNHRHHHVDDQINIHCSSSSYYNCKNITTSQSLVEHKKPPGAASVLRWRKRVGQLLQRIRWRRSLKVPPSSSCNYAGVDGVGVVKVGKKSHKGWITAFTSRKRRRTKE